MLRTLRKAFLAGFFILLPALLAYLLLGGFVDVIVLLTTPILDLLPYEDLLTPWERRLLAIAIMCALFIVVGLLRNTRPARRLGRWIERGVGDRFPPYRLVRDMTRQMRGQDVADMKGVMVPLEGNARTLGFVVEELQDGLATVFIPMTSIPTVGQLRILPLADVEPVPASLMDSLGWYLNWGRGTDALMDR